MPIFLHDCLTRFHGMLSRYLQHNDPRCKIWIEAAKDAKKDPKKSHQNALQLLARGTIERETDIKAGKYKLILHLNKKDV